MASAVLASTNEPYWGERKVYMRRYTNSTTNSRLSNFNPNPNSIPISTERIHDFSTKAHLWQSDEPRLPKNPPPVASDSSSSPNRMALSLDDRRESSYGGYVCFNLAACSKAQLSELKRRLVSELQQVRSLRARIESLGMEARSGCLGQFSGGYGTDREVASVRPPSLQLNHKSESSNASASKERRTPKANQYYAPNDFVIGKSKTAPISNTKKVSGNKRASNLSAGGCPKRPAVLDSHEDKLLTSMMRRCRQILTKLMKHKHAWVFNNPVDTVALGLHDYHQIIKHPMDLGTVKSRLEKDEYESPQDFASDVRLTFSNAMTYNPKGQDVYIMAETLLSRFEEMFVPANKKLENEQRRVAAVEQTNRTWARPPPVEAPTPEAEIVSRPADLMHVAKKSDAVPMRSEPLSSPPVQMHTSAMSGAVVPRGAKSVVPQSVKSVFTSRSMPKLPKPKAKDPNKRQMSFEEKAKLGMSLQNLPQEKMEQLLLIIKKRNPDLAQDGDEIELDIETLDNETLWELDRFVTYHKKAMSKMMRQGLIQNSISTALMNKLPEDETTPEEAGVQKSKKGEAGEEDVDIGEEIPMNNFPPVEIEKDAACASSRSSSSSSSGSSDSSSSSDSDSGSSSGSGSDADSVQSPFVDSKEVAVT